MRDPLAPQLGRPQANDAVAGHGVRRVARMVRGIGLGAVRTHSGRHVRLMPLRPDTTTGTTFASASGRNVLRLQTGDGDVLRRGLWILENTQPASRTSASPVSYRHDMVRLKPDTTSE